MPEERQPVRESSGASSESGRRKGNHGKETKDL